MVNLGSIGFSAGKFGRSGDLAALDKRLGQITLLGANLCELGAVSLDVVASCRLIPNRVKQLKDVLSQHTIQYSLHAPIAINLMDHEHIEIQTRAAEVSLELASECEANIVVFHPGRTHPASWVDKSRELLMRERDSLALLADQAEKLGVRIAYENISPNPRVIEGLETSYSLDLVQLAEQIEAVDHPALVACLDVSHAIQGAVLQQFDLYEQASRLAPLVEHIHFSDSTGIPATIECKNEGEKLFFGIGDMHAPPGFGAIEFDRLAKSLQSIKKASIAIELKDNHFAHSADLTLSTAREFASKIGATGQA